MPKRQKSSQSNQSTPKNKEQRSKAPNNSNTPNIANMSDTSEHSNQIPQVMMEQLHVLVQQAVAAALPDAMRSITPFPNTSSDTASANTVETEAGIERARVTPQDVAIIAEVVKQMTEPASDRQPPHVFSGQMAQDPSIFLQRLEHCLEGRRLEIPDDIDNAVTQYLEGDALRWYRKHRGTFRCLPDFTRAFREEFTSDQRQLALQTAVYNTRMREDDIPTAFVGKLRQLCLRYNPSWPERELVLHLTSRLTREYRIYVSHARPQTVVELFEECDRWYSNFRPDISEEPSRATKLKKLYDKVQEKVKSHSQPSVSSTKANAGPRDNVVSTPQPSMSSTSPGPSLPKCWYCPGYHFNRDCPTASKRTPRSQSRRPESPKRDKERKPKREDAMVAQHDMSVSPRVMLRIRDQDVIALIDTASSTSLAKSKFAELPLEHIEPHHFTLATPEARLEINQSGRLRATIGEYRFQSTVLVSDNITPDVLLGYPWLVEQRAIIDTTRGCMYVGTSTRHTIHFINTPMKMEMNTQEMAESDIELPNVPRENVDGFRRIFREFHELFEEGQAIATTATTQHTIRLTDEIPVKVRPYRYPPEKKRVIAEQVQKMLAAGVIRPSHSEYNSPIVIVQKKSGEPRFCIDFRKLNAKTRDEVSPLPPIQESLKDLGTAKVFSTLDLRNGYWQIPLAEESKKYTAFTTPDGAAYEFNVMCFGLKSAPTTFQKLMAQEVLVGYLRDFAIAYLDDIIIYSDTWTDHQRHLRLVFERLAQHGLRLNLEKCRFATNSLDYLGHLVTSEGNRPQSIHLEAIQNTTPPKSRKALRQLLGTINWIRDYIPRSSTIMAPLTDLLSSKRPYKWTKPADAALEEIKKAVAKPLFLSRPDFSKPFVLQTDASSIGAAAVLYQLDENKRRIISYASLRFNATEQKYHINEQECLAMIWAIRKYRPYLEDRHFTLRTDSKAITWLHQFKETRSKLMRWSLLLQEFNFTIEHVPGKHNELPDLLSRNPVDECTTDDLESVDRLIPDERRVRPKSTKQGPASHHVFAIEDEDPLFIAIQKAQQEDQELIELTQRLTEADPEDEIHRRFRLADGFVQRRIGENYLTLVPVPLRQRVVYQYHDHHTAGHPGIEETTRSIRQHFHWLTIQQDVVYHVRSCILCNSYKRGPHQPGAPLRPHPPTRPFETVAVDIIGPLTESRTGNRYGIVLTDLYSRWIECTATKVVETHHVTNFLLSVFQRFGFPRAIITDNGPQFTSIPWDAAIREWDTMHWTTPIYHPRSNPVERRNQELKKVLKLQLEGNQPEQWDTKLETVLFNLRCRQNAATGYTPARALFGYELRRPGDWRDPNPAVHEPADRRQRRVHANERRYRERRYVNPTAPMPIQPNVGDFVMVKVHAAPGQPFGPKWMGPYPVVETAGPTSVWVERPGANRAKYHIDDIRPTRRTDGEDLRQRRHPQP